MININELYNFLLNDNILIYENEIFNLIPELKYEKGFDQKSEWHCYDVWNHTIATVNACDMNPVDRVTMLLHDIGKPFSYQDDGETRHFKSHAIKSAEMSKIILGRFNIPEEDKNLILKLIELHSIKINLDDVNSDNINFYRRLCRIQLCDAKGYEEEHSKMIINKLDSTSKKLSKNE